MPLEISDELKIQKNRLEQKDPWIWLCEIELPEGWLRITDHVEDVPHWPTPDGPIWHKYPVQPSSIKITSKGEVTTATVIVGNADGALDEYIEDNVGLIGKKGNLYRVNMVKLDDPTYSVIPEKFKVVAAAARNEIVTFSLTLGIDAYGIEGPIESFDRDKFPSMPIINPRISIGII